MFEVGKDYRITTIDGDATSYIVSTVVEVNMPLIKVTGPGREEIINTGSPIFVKAELVDSVAQQAAHKSFMDSLSSDDKSL